MFHPSQARRLRPRESGTCPRPQASQMAELVKTRWLVPVYTHRLLGRGGESLGSDGRGLKFIFSGSEIGQRCVQCWEIQRIQCQGHGVHEKRRAMELSCCNDRAQRSRSVMCINARKISAQILTSLHVFKSHSVKFKLTWAWKSTSEWGWRLSPRTGKKVPPTVPTAPSQGQRAPVSAGRWESQVEAVRKKLIMSV